MSRILVTGTTGFIGKELFKFLFRQGHEVVPLSLRKKITQDLSGFDAVVHLAGEPLAPGRWTKAKQAKILSSRVEGTKQLVAALAKSPPKTFLCASAIGYYGDRGDELLTEDSSPGDNFLAHVCKAWEAASEPLRATGTRVIHARFSMVLAKDGGALKQLILPTKCYLGATLGSGNQWISWITRTDLIRAIDHLLKTDSLSDAVNICTPNPVQQKTFNQTLAKALHRKTFLRLPAWLIDLLFGLMGKEMLLASTRADPRKLLESNFSFQTADLDSALKGCL